MSELSENTHTLNGKDLLSVIIPISERCDAIEEIYQEYRKGLNRLETPYEMIFIVDGDFPGEYAFLKELKKSMEENLSIVKLSRTFGEATAISEGFSVARGELILTLPAYHQVEVDSLHLLFEAIKGYDLVAVRRWPRNDSSMNRSQTKLFHRLVKTITGVPVNDIGCSVRLFRRKVLTEIHLYGDLHRFLPILADKRGFRIREVDIPQSKMEKLIRTYKTGIYIRRAIDLLTVFFLVKFTKKPLRFFGFAGTAILLPGIILTMVLVIGRLMGKFGLSGRPLFLVGILLIVLGIQIFAIGLVGEIIIFSHAKDIKDYTVEKIIE